MVPLFLLGRKFRPSRLTHPLTLAGLTGDNLHWIGIRSCGGRLDRYFHVLVSLSQEDWVRKAG